MDVVYLQGGILDGKTYEKESDDLSTIRIPYKNSEDKELTDVYMKVLNSTKTINKVPLEVYLYKETVEG